MTRAFRVRLFRLTAVLTALLFTLLLPAGVSAQRDDPPPSDTWAPDDVAVDDTDWSGEVPAHISNVEGRVVLDREGSREDAGINTVLLAGDRLQTGSGRVEVLFEDGGGLTLDQDTTAEFLSDSLIRLERGRIRLDVARGAEEYRVDGAGSTAWIRAAGEYRLAVSDAGEEALQLAVRRGLAELSSPYGRTLVRAGYEASTSARTAPSAPYAVAVSRWDDLDRWTDGQRDQRYGLTSAQYLPEEIRYYGSELDRHGSWRNEPSYGYVWYPHVDVGWQPYSVGHWSYAGVYGWVWIGADRWSWPTHHYGRWGYRDSRWYWIPDRRWAPAWVAWASSPGYVGWSPLGYNNRPIISINLGWSSGWRAWNLAPSRSFYGRRVVAPRGRYAVPRDTRFVLAHRGPARPAGVRDTPGFRGYTSTTRRVNTTGGSRVSGERVDRSPGLASRPSDSRALPRRSPETPIERGARVPGARAGSSTRPADSIASRPGGLPASPASRGTAVSRPRTGSTPSSPSTRQPRAMPPSRVPAGESQPSGRVLSSPPVRSRTAPRETPAADESNRVARPRAVPRGGVDRGPSPNGAPAAPSPRATAPRERVSAPAPRERVSAPAPRERVSAPAPRERASAPSRASRPEVSRPAPRQSAPAGSSRSSGGSGENSGRARARAR